MFLPFVFGVLYVVRRAQIMFLGRNELWEFMEASREQLTDGPACTIARLISVSHL